jgi:hypothetical protein
MYQWMYLLAVTGGYNRERVGKPARRNGPAVKQTTPWKTKGLMSLKDA